MTDTSEQQSTNQPTEDTEISEEYEFLLPGPTPETNEGCLGWGLAWGVFSVFLILIIAIVTVSCYFIGLVTGIV